MFYDLCIPYQSDVDLMKRLLIRAKNLGYNVVAIDNVVHDKLTNKHVNPIHELLRKIGSLDEEDNEDEPILAIEGLDDEESNDRPNKRLKHTPKSQGDSRKFKILTRLTVTIESSSDHKGLNNTAQATNQYDIIGVKIDGDDKVLASVTNALDVDIINVNLHQRLPYFIKHSTVQVALERGIFFEVCYGMAIRDLESRKHLFSNGTMLARALKAKQMIFTSEALSPIHLRNPYDVSNLGSLLELNQQMAKLMVTKLPHSLVLRAETRRTSAKAVIQPSSLASQPLPSFAQS